MTRLDFDDQRQRVGAWAARHDEATLLAGMRCWLGPGARKPDTARAQAALAFAVIAPPPDGDALFERYAAAARALTRVERQVLEAWSRTWVSVLRTTAVYIDEGLDVHDVLRDRHFRIRERSATHQLQAGDWLLASYVEVDGRTVFEGVLWVLPFPARVRAVQAGLEQLTRAGVTGTTATCAETRRMAYPMVEAAQAELRPPRFLNADGHDIVPITSTLDIGWDALVDTLDAWDDADIGDDHVNLRGVAQPLHEGHPVCRAAFHRKGQAVTLFTNSRERFHEVLGRWQAATGAPLRVVREDVHPSKSSPDGQPFIVDTQLVDAPEGTTHAEAMADTLSTWCDRPVPALGGLSPRQAARSGRRAEVWALLWDPGLATLLGLDDPTSLETP